ncbi:MAG: hypothetical protein JRN56_05455 [Nitrososphaerota archaeon]|nr:hypothetical protein [Nitrososphaerota archaeon]MDG6957095.1 hypothetical protein [Nitrososphaerota archaeon]MDG6961838.1 hypothetical protein [Nitrososphaerota archaeon]MDG6970584.1 hypothetical protein [Nitrososphaerota archaeon]MDG6993184.1 hypothetical protein [Nitrososphaerota archaeon]
MAYRDTPRAKHGRRSKLDIVGDVLRAIREGAERPTNIMFKANLTWPLTLVYLELLLRHRMVSAETNGGRMTYKLEPKGALLLRSYLELEESAAELELGRLDDGLMSKVIADRKLTRAQGSVPLDSVRATMERKGYMSRPGSLRGLSGVEHSFDLLMESREGTKLGYMAVDELKAADIMKAFIMQTDCEFKVDLVCKSEPDQDARELAAAYGVNLITKEGRGSAVALV